MKEYKVWDVGTRLFHWINFFAIFILMFVGLIMLFKGDLGIESMAAKIALKELHVIVGYIFVLNLAWRIIWGFIGNRYARWSSVLPGQGFGGQLKSYVQSLKTDRPQQFIGHNPAGRLAVTVIYLVLVVMAVTGLVRAGTDVYYPPFGSMAAEYIADVGVDPAGIHPYDKTGVDEARYKQLKAFKEPFGEVHVYLAYFLMFLVLVHVTAVVASEIRERSGLVSAMLSGRKLLSHRPADEEEAGGI